jgi:NAD+ kinase
MDISIVQNKNYQEIAKLRKVFHIVKKGEICVAFGGDGTFISAARKFACPILFVRSGENGSTGYYSDVSVKDIDIIIEKLKNKNYTVEDLSRKILISYKGKNHYAINEALLSGMGKEIYFDIYLKSANGESKVYPYTISGDGVLITGNVGSTAYNRTARGPIILSKDVICLNLLFAEGPITNPIILDGDTEIRLAVVKRGGKIMQDGHPISSINAGESFTVKLSDMTTKVVKLNGFIETFSDKLDRMIRNKMVGIIPKRSILRSTKKSI